MAVDTRLKRQSATCILLPHMLSSAPPDTSGVVQAEWQAMAWMYSGITASAASSWFMAFDIKKGDFFLVRKI